MCWRLYLGTQTTFLLNPSHYDVPLFSNCCSDLTWDIPLINDKYLNKIIKYNIFSFYMAII
jgi:hypothetical protein